jgi:hypothetical protein
MRFASFKSSVVTFFGPKWFRIVDLFFHDEARLVEWISMLVMFGFGIEFLISPEIMQRPVYAEFATLGAPIWSIGLFGAAAFQLFAILNRRWAVQDIRFFALLLGFAFFSALTFTFAQTAISTTATRTYGVIAVSCFLSGVFVLWNLNRSSH